MAEKQKIFDWLDEKEASVAVLVGPGGIGKSRLAFEVGAHVAGRGWRAGILVDSWTASQLESFLADPTPALVLVDYAEGQVEKLTLFLSRAFREAASEVYVLLISRVVGGVQGWLDRLKQEVPVLYDLVRLEIPLQRMPLLKAGEAAAIAHALAEELGAPEPPPGSIQGGTYLEQEIRCLSSILGSDTTDLEALLGHESKYLRGVAESKGAPSSLIRFLPRIVSFIVYLGGVRRNEAAQCLRRAFPDFQDIPLHEMELLLDALEETYPGPTGWIEPLRPDRLGEAHVAREDEDGLVAIAAFGHSGSKTLDLLERLEQAGETAYLQRFMAWQRQQPGMGLLSPSSLAALRTTERPAAETTAEEPDEHRGRLSQTDFQLVRSLMLSDFDDFWLKIDGLE